MDHNERILNQLESAWLNPDHDVDEDYEEEEEEQYSRWEAER